MIPPTGIKARICPKCGHRAFADRCEICTDQTRMCEEIPCPDCYGGHFRPCQVCGDSGIAFLEVPTTSAAPDDPKGGQPRPSPDGANPESAECRARRSATALEAAARSPFSAGLRQLFDVHSALLVENPHCYCELAYTRQTGWMAWLCSKPQTEDPQRKVLGVGQGQTPDQAAFAAVDSYCDGGPSANAPCSATGAENQGGQNEH